MGEVWLGKRTAMGSAAKVVAVKLLRTPDAAAREGFVKEAKLAMLLRHSTIVQVNDVGESQGICYMEMEWVDGLDLARLGEALRELGQRLDLGIAAYVIGELLKALAFAHALDVEGKRETIVHRDITPHNVLISKSGEVKLTDFGIAFMTSDKTAGELVKGKSRYMSPEHVRQVREPCIDIFGVGAIFHELVDGRKFRHTAGSDVDLWAMAFAGDVPTLSIELPAELEELRRGLLAREVGERFANARAALAALRRWPGYRDASEELETLVRATTVADEVPLAATEQLPALPLARNESTTPEQGQAPQAEASETRSTTSKPASRGDANRWAAIGLALIGLGLAGWSSSLFFVATDEQVAEADAPSAEAPPAETPAVEEPVQPKPVEKAPPVEAPPVEAPPVEAPPVEAPPVEIKPAAKTKTAVTLGSAYPWVQIRIGTAIHVLDRKTSPTKKISLEAGSYSVEFQVDEEEPWQKLGKVTIPARPSAKLTLQKPGKLVVE